MLRFGTGLYFIPVIYSSEPPKVRTVIVVIMIVGIGLVMVTVFVMGIVIVMVTVLFAVLWSHIAVEWIGADSSAAKQSAERDEDNNQFNPLLLVFCGQFKKQDRQGVRRLQGCCRLRIFISIYFKIDIIKF